MGIFKRVKDIALADVNEALDKWEDPISMLKQYLREMEKDLLKAQEAISNQLYLESKYEAMMEETKEIIVKRSRQAELAVEKNEEEIAKLAIQDKITHENKLQIYQEQLETIKSQTNVLMEQLKSLKEQYDELNNRKLVLISRANVAQMANGISKTLVSINSENAIKGFKRMEEEVLKLEAKAKANNLLNKTPNTLIENTIDGYLQTEIQKELDRLKESKATQL